MDLEAAEQAAWSDCYEFLGKVESRGFTPGPRLLPPPCPLVSVEGCDNAWRIWWKEKQWPVGWNLEREVILG